MKIKYPRTYHLPASPGITHDDKIISHYDNLMGKEVVITIKMDGENSSLYPDGYTHARSLDSTNHPSRNWLKAWWYERCYLLEPTLRICGENLYARHSISYEKLASYFYGFSVWQRETILSWDETVKIFLELDIVSVPVLFKGILTEEIINDQITKLTVGEFKDQEGFVIRRADSFKKEDFDTYVAKWVRANHVTTNDHWMYQSIVTNKLAK